MPRETSVVRPEDAISRFRERELAELAGRQCGVVSREQLLRLGVATDAIQYRLRIGRLHRLHDGVYAVGHSAVSRHGRWLAAVLASGNRAVLSHRSAAELWGMLLTRQRVMEVTTPRSTGSLHRLRRHSGALRHDEVTTHHDIPVTTPGRTVIDLASVASMPVFQRGLREAEFLRLPMNPSLAELAQRHAGRRGMRMVNRALRELELLPGGSSRSRLEDRFRRFLIRHDLPLPETNVVIGLDEATYEVDCLWRTQRLIAELDGHEGHGTRSAFESDRERDRHLQVAGWQTIRITWRQLDHPSAALARDLRLLLAVPEALNLRP